MSSALHQTVRVSADHSIVMHHPDWNPGEELEVLVRAKTALGPAYSFLDVLKNASLETQRITRPATSKSSKTKVRKQYFAGTGFLLALVGRPFLSPYGRALRSGTCHTV